MDRKDGITARLLRNGGNQALRISRGSELSGTNVRTCRLPNGSLEIESMTKTELLAAFKDKSSVSAQD